jgi:type VI secretion system protein ImpF
MTSAEVSPSADLAAVPQDSTAAWRAVHPGMRASRPPGTVAARVNTQLLPTLFDRLRDEQPAQKTEAASAYTVSAAQMRDIIQRDLTYLLNTTNIDDLIDGERFADAASSCINFGVRPLAGGYLSERRWEDIEQIIRRAIADFEPRLIPDTVMVLLLAKEDAHEGYNVLQFEIRAMINLKPYPLELTVQSSVDLETNRVQVTRQHANGPRRAAR